MFKRIDHVELLTAHPARTLAFYTEVLGFRIARRMQVPSTPHGPLELVYLELGGTTVELMTYLQAKLEAAAGGLRPGYQLMALEVEDMDAAVAHLKAHGVEPSWGPVKRPEYARAEIRDPDGNGIELRQWHRGDAAGG